MVLLIDNYDGFSYNLFQLFGSLGAEVKVVRNDAIALPGIVRLSPSHLVLSPGPGRPEDAGICLAAVKEVGSLTGIPILGVGLGHQAVCAAFGAKAVAAKALVHGRRSVVTLRGGSRIFAGLPEKIEAARYHALVVDPATMPACLRTTAVSEDGEIMAVEHAALPIFGVQFQPESFLTPLGGRIAENFLAIGKGG